MVMDQQQQPIVRDFLGLGKLVTGDQGVEAHTSTKPSFLSIRSLHSPSTVQDLKGMQQPVCSLTLSMEPNFPSRKTSEEVCTEGRAEKYGMAVASQWQEMVPGTNTMIGGPAARVLTSDAHAKPNGTQLTIFYGGLVNVYNNIDTDKAGAIMHMAGNGNLLSSNGMTWPPGVPHVLGGTQGFCQLAGSAENLCINVQAGPTQFVGDQTSQNCPAANTQFEAAIPDTPSSASSPQPVVPKALPLARKASLARFLEKRKERMKMMMPYFKKQFPAAQAPSTGDQMVGPFHPATLAKLYNEYYRRPTTMVFGMPEHMAPHHDMSSSRKPAKQ